LLLGLRGFGHRLVRNRAEGIDWRIVVGRVLAKTGLFFIVMASAELVAEHAETPPVLLRAINFLFVFAAAFQAAIWVRELVLGLVESKVGTEEGAHSTLGSAIGIIRLLVTVALFAIAIILILDNLGVNVTGLVAGLGIGGIAIGLAAQGIFKDLFSALSIIFDRPFRRGDTITFDQTTGTVEQIGLKSTRIRSLGGEEVVMSNDNLLNTKIQNWALLQRRRQVMTLALIYQTPPQLLERLPWEVQAIVERQPLAAFDRAHVSAFNQSSIDLELVFFVETAEYPVFMHVKQEIMLGILRRFEELGVSFAYPTQTTFTAAPDGTMILPYPHVKIVATEDPGD
ncbi:MAG TPA: mechanosensitive ion channel domain-containing protein, partial [Allosphingosinicella sp.]|nr:mechanosensitive ion channel domain-containing protein [Allosphingosinicella sp.]